MAMMPTSQSTAGAHVSARGWSWRYGSRSRPTFNLLDLDIDPGERVLRLGASGSGKSTLVAAVGLSLPLDHSTAKLSGGQKQRLALSGVLVMRPGLIILDEPTANLDPDGVREIRDAVEAVALESGATLLIVEHRVDVWWDLVTRVIVLDSDGNVLRDGAPASVAEGTRELLTRIGMVFQSPEHQFLTGSVREELMVGPRALERRGSRLGHPTASPAFSSWMSPLLDKMPARGRSWWLSSRNSGTGAMSS